MMLPAPWLQRAEIQTLSAAFAQGGYALRFVGGCVRDTLMGREVGEIDAASNATPEQMIALLEVAGLRAIPTGMAHGTITALVAGAAFEITTLRKDVATDGRHAEVAFTNCWEEDAKRRDFTMNALYLGLDGTLYDDVAGLEDCKAGYVRFIGDASQRIQEDYLRILRYFRFVATLGRNQFDAVALAACRAHKAGISQLSGERIAQEFLKLLAAKDAVSALEAMQQQGILEHLLPDAPCDLSVQTKLPADAPALWRLAALIADPALVSGIAARLKLSSKQRKALALWLLEAAGVLSDMSLRAQKKRLRHIGAADYIAVIHLAYALSDQEWSAFAALIELAQWQPPLFPITAADLMAQGILPGKLLGERLKALEQQWEDSDYKLTREELLIPKQQSFMTLSFP